MISFNQKIEQQDINALLCKRFFITNTFCAKAVKQGELHTYFFLHKMYLYIYNFLKPNVCVFRGSLKGKNGDLKIIHRTSSGI